MKPAHGTNACYSNGCRKAECRRAHADVQAEWRRRNIERVRAYENRYYAEHREARIATHRAYRAKNLARLNARRRYLAAKKRAAA
jgi:hypothetical protein